MFILTVRIPRRRLILGAVCTLFLCAAVLLGAMLSAGEALTASGGGPDMDRQEDRLAYLEELGWEVVQEPLAQQDLLIPTTFDESYDQYLALQASQGFDLTPYQGEKITRYTYEITNYPTGEEGVQVNLLVHKGTLIAGEVLSPRSGGVLHGLSRQEAAG